MPALAFRDSAVLGSSTEVADAIFPPVTSGPGHILPDSPFYFLDKLYQDFRLALVFTPANKARLHLAIGGERLAELRVESSRNNQAGVDTALLEFEHESMAAANDVRDAASQGQDVTQLARDIHQAMTDYGNVLDTVKAQVPDTAYEQKLATASNVLWEARTLTEDALPEGDLKREKIANATVELDKAVLGVSTSADKLQKKLAIYQQYASRAAEHVAKKKIEEASRAAGLAQRKAIQVQKEKAIQDYLIKVQALQKQREAELTQLKKTIQDLQNQLKQLRQAQPNVIVTTTPTPTISSQ